MISNKTPKTVTATQEPSKLRSWYVVAALSFASIVSYIDRHIINLLVEPIKADLGLTDVQVSLLQGFSFALLYVVLAVPLAWVSDRHNRKWVIIGGLICWSAATFSSGLAMGFAVLFCARMMVGIGEATLAPAGFSMLADYFNKKNLPAAISIFTGSGFMGTGLALIIGGYIISHFEAMGGLETSFGTFAPWQLTFMTLSLMSIPVFFALLLIREPKRKDGNVTLADDDAPPALEIFEFLKKRARIFIPLFIGFSCFASAQFGVGAWAPSYFIRIHGWSELKVGSYFGPVVMFAGIGGVVLGGFVANRLLERGVSDATLRLPLFAVLLAMPFAISFPQVQSPYTALALLSVLIFLGSVPFGAGVSTFPMITPNRMRAQVVAVYLMIANLIGFSAGPLLIAWLTDNIFENPAALDQSLAIAPPATMVIGIILIAISLKPYKLLIQDQERTES